MELFRKLTGKEIAVIVTSAGGIVLATLLAWMYWKTTSNHIDHTNSAILQQAISNEKVAGAIQKLTDVIDRKIK